MAKNYDELAVSGASAAGRKVMSAAIPVAKGFVKANLLPLTTAASYGIGAVKGAGQALGFNDTPATPVATPRASIPTATRTAPQVAAQSVSPSAGPRVSRLPVSMEQSGYGITEGLPVTPLAPAAIPLTDRATVDVNPALAAAPKARAIVPQNAVLDVNPYADMPRPGYDASKHVAWTPGMESIAAMNLRRQMAQETGATMDRDYRKFGGMSARGQQLQSRWDEAARAAFTGAMTPQQEAAYERELAAERMRQGAAFRESPQYQMGEQALRRDVGVAGEQARGLIGASATKAEQERLNREATAENERMRQAGDTGRTAMTTGELREGRKEVAEERRATADEQRKAREASAIGDQIAKLYASFEKVPEGTPAAKSLADRIAKLEAQHDKMLGIVQQGSEGAQSNAQRIAMLQERLAQYPNDPKAPAARAELKRLQALK